MCVLYPREGQQTFFRHALPICSTSTARKRKHAHSARKHKHSTAHRNGCSTAHSLVLGDSAGSARMPMLSSVLRTATLLAMGARHSRGQVAGRAVPVDWIGCWHLELSGCLSSGGGNDNIILHTYLHSPPLALSHYCTHHISPD